MLFNYNIVLIIIICNVDLTIVQLQKAQHWSVHTITRAHWNTVNVYMRACTCVPLIAWLARKAHPLPLTLLIFLLTLYNFYCEIKPIEFNNVKILIFANRQRASPKTKIKLFCGNWIVRFTYTYLCFTARLFRNEIFNFQIWRKNKNTLITAVKQLKFYKVMGNPIKAETLGFLVKAILVDNRTKQTKKIKH